MGKKMIQWVKKNKYLAIILLFVVLWALIPPLINLMMNTEPLLFADFFGYINSENANTWIEFYGAIIGGAITLLGVAWTIIDQNKKREEDMKDALKPILIADRCKNEKIGGISDEVGTKVFSCTLEYKNVGRGVLYNPAVYNIEYSVDGKELGEMKPVLSVRSTVDINAVAGNSVMITFKPEVLKHIMRSLEGRGNTILLQIIMYVGGKDMFGRDVVTKLEYTSKLSFFSEEELQLPLSGGAFTGKVLFSEEEINEIIQNANKKYNVHC